MSCKNGEVSTEFLDTDGSTILRFPTFTLSGTYSKNFKLATPNTNIALSWQDILDRSNITLPTFDLNGKCKDFIEPSLDFVNDDQGGCIWPPDIFSCPTIIKWCKKCKRIFGRRFCTPKYPCGLSVQYSYQPYWELVDIPIPDEDLINFTLPSMEFTGDITVASSFSIGGFLSSDYIPIVNLFTSLINGNTSASNISKHMIILLSEFINTLIKKFITGEYSAAEFFKTIIAFDILQITYVLNVKNFIVNIGSNKFIIPNFSDNRVINIFSLEENRYLSLTIKPPDEFSFDINVFILDLWPLLINAIKLYEKTLTAEKSLIAKISPDFEKIMSTLGIDLTTLALVAVGGGGLIVASKSSVIFDWLEKHFSISIGISFKICPANLLITPTNPVALVPISLCYTLYVGFKPFTENEITYINNKVSRGLASVTDGINKLKMSSDVNNSMKDIVKLMGGPSGYGFNETILIALHYISVYCNIAVEEIIDIIININLDVAFTQCFAPPIPIPI